MPKCVPIGSYGQNQALAPGACLGEKRSAAAKNGQQTITKTRKTRKRHVTLLKIQNAPMLARNAPFAHLGASRACQSVSLSVRVAKTRHSGRMFGRKTARKRPKRDRIGFTATGFVLAQDPRTACVLKVIR
jgi:hypothetical protein